jgi:Cd2+/Zn2+-exporting ATPase
MEQNENATQTLFVSGVCCATEEAIVRKHLNALAGPDGYTFNPLTCELRLHDATKTDVIARMLTKSGFATRSKRELGQPQSFWDRHGNGVLTGTAALLAVTGIAGEQMETSVEIVRGLLLSAIVIAGWRVFVKAWKSVRTYAFDMNVLMSAAVVGALVIGKWSEGAAVMVLFAVSLMLESYSASRTRRAIQSLMALSPEQACVDQDGRESIIPAKDVVPGQHVVIRPGERIPIDGIVMEGQSYVNQSAITGEATPVAKTVGEHVFAGSINNHGSLRVRATSRYEETTLARIVHLVEEAQLERAPVQNLVDRFARIYTPAVLLLALAVAVLPPLVLQASFSEWFYRALVLLVIACPCALVISTPVTIVSALTHAARLGILIKGGKHIETLSHVQAVAFDKTGTLTHGQPTVTDIVPLNSASRERILQIAAALEHRSEHPLASAIMREAARHSVDHARLSVEGFEALPGFGVKATIEGVEYFLGNHELVEEKGFCSPAVEQVLARLEHEGKTAVVLGNGIEALCVLAVRDAARDQSKHAVNALRKMGVKRMMLISGDHETSARRLADEVGIDEYRAALLPQQKIEVIEQLKKEHGTVAMVGDGVNDAPALAAASVGIAMGGSGTDTALETADVVLMGDDLSKLPLLVRLSRNATRIVKQNIAIALSLKLLFLVLSVSGVATLWMAVLADDGAALIVILNGLRALTLKEHV